jgi:hypothetical protein
MFPHQELSNAIANRKCLYGNLDLPAEAFPTWDELIPYLDQSFTNGTLRIKDYKKWFVNMGNDFPIVEDIKSELGKVTDSIRMSCHLYGGFSPKAIASPPHKDGMDVFFVMIKGTCPWKTFENGCDYDDRTQTMTSKATFSQRLVPGDFCYIPTGIYHCAVPDSSRIGFSFGWS